MDLYIYYRVREEDCAALEPRVRAMQARLAHALDLDCGLKRRLDARDGRQTWMETYGRAAPDAVDTIERAAQDAGLAALTDGQRHAEIFMDVSPCA